MLLLLPKSQPLRWVVIWDRRSAAFFDLAEISVLTVICIKITTPFGVVIFMDTERDFTCSGEIKLPCAKVLAFGQNVCTAQKRRQPAGRLGALSEPFAGSENIQIGVQFHKNRSFRLKRAALFLGEKEPPAILVGFPHML